MRIVHEDDHERMSFYAKWLVDKLCFDLKVGNRQLAQPLPEPATCLPFVVVFSAPYAITHVTHYRGVLTMTEHLRPSTTGCEDSHPVAEVGSVRRK